MFILVIIALVAAFVGIFLWTTMRAPRPPAVPPPATAGPAIDWHRYAFPTLLRRVLSSSIDGILVLLLVFAVGLYAPGSGEWAGRYKLSLFVFLLIWYEPVLTSSWCTLGQAITGIRVRRIEDPEARIGLGAALLRTCVKGILGIVSFFTIPFAERWRAIHDMAAGSVVVRAPG